MIPHNRVYIITLTMTLVGGQLITFEDGKLGVNFAGFRAAVGIGGLLNGDLSKGGLHVEAGTPFGQFAQAGLKGEMGENGKMGGRLYAGATAGNGISATAGLQGAMDETGAVGQAAAGTSYFGRTSGVENTVMYPNSGSASSTNQDNNKKSVLRFERNSETQDDNEKKDDDEQVSTSTKKPENKPDNTIYITKNKKKLTKYAQVHYDALHKGVIRPVNITYAEKPLSSSVSTVNTQISNEPAQGGLLSMLLGSLGNRNIRDSEDQNQNKEETKDTSATTSTSTQSPYYHKKIIRFSGPTNGNKSRTNLFDDIFNIPISTLQAVNRLVNNIVGGHSVSVSKHVN